jgi:hypothetical protein
VRASASGRCSPRAPSNPCGLLGDLYSLRGGPFSVMVCHASGESPSVATLSLFWGLLPPFATYLLSDALPLGGFLLLIFLEGRASLPQPGRCAGKGASS